MADDPDPMIVEAIRLAEQVGEAGRTLSQKILEAAIQLDKAKT